MALEMTGDFQLSAPREFVWEKLNDPDVLKACIPGCEELEKLPESKKKALISTLDDLIRANNS